MLFGQKNERAVQQGCPSSFVFFASYIFLVGAAPASLYSPVQVYSPPPSAVPVFLQVPDPIMPFIFPVPPVTWYLFPPENAPSFTVPVA